MVLKELTRGLINILIPPVCLLCEKKLNSNDFLCAECQNFERNLPPFCLKCGLGISSDSTTKLCPRCRGKKFYFTRNLSPFLFKEPLSELIHLFKYKNLDFLSHFFSKKIIEFIQELNLPLENYHLITAVPLHSRKIREREFNQSRLLAQDISEYFGITYEDILGVRRYLKPQVKKTAEERIIDVRDNFYIIEGSQIKGKNIIIIDDVFTTGATLSECAKTLKSKGAKDILTITVAIKK